MVDLLQIIQNMVALLNPISTMIYVLCFMTGVLFVLAGLRAAARRTETGPNGGSYGAPFTRIVIGVLFISLPALILSLTTTFFATSVPSADMIFAYAPETIGLFDTDSPGRTMLTGIVMIVQFVGLIAVIRGLILLNQTAQGGGGPKTFGPGITFVISGIMAINFPLFIGAIEQLITAG